MSPSPKAKDARGGEVHWSKDYVEHLRTAHFALILASAALIALVLTAKPYDVTKALTQIQQILKLKADWGRNWLFYAMKKAQADGSVSPVKGTLERPWAEKQSFQVKANQQQTVVRMAITN